MASSTSPAAAAAPPGSTLVHSVGGWAALVTVWLLGARIGKFKDGKPQAIPGHSIPLATAGVLILWLGWFGFNGGSVLSADPEATSLTLVTTCLAAAAGGVVAMITSTILYKNLDLTMFLNGILGGLVGITAGADQMSPEDAILIGAIAGVLIVFAVRLVDKIKLDDPVGAIAVHLICGVWGTLAVGLFGAKAGFDQFVIQLIGVACYAVFCIVTSFVIISTHACTHTHTHHTHHQHHNRAHHHTIHNRHHHHHRRPHHRHRHHHQQQPTNPTRGCKNSLVNGTRNW